MHPSSAETHYDTYYMTITGATVATVVRSRLRTMAADATAARFVGPLWTRIPGCITACTLQPNRTAATKIRRPRSGTEG